ncbi:MAG: hypothetical protein WD295_02485, partial [Bacteroidota bacterium]
MIHRKLQGGQIRTEAGTIFGTTLRTSAIVTGATARGQFTTSVFQGAEGNQGPYRLTGRNGERLIIVIAGSERVYVNGEPMIRGEVNDYTIDYAAAEITFSNRRLMTSASRISVDFEYADRQYRRNVASAFGSAESAGGSFRLVAGIQQEADDPDSPLDLELGPEEKERLRESGSDRLRASVPGIRFAGFDSTRNIGLGQYILKDTVFGATPARVLVYSPGDPAALYSASFSLVTPMPRDSVGYRRVRLGHFEAAGPGQGNYLPIRILPQPRLHRVANVVAGGDLGGGLDVVGEFAGSTLDKNRFSSIDDADRSGAA